MQFQPFDDNPNNVLNQSLIDTAGIAVSDLAAEALCNVDPSESASMCQRVKAGENFLISYGCGTAILRWSDRYQRIILTSYKRSARGG